MLGLDQDLFVGDGCETHYGEEVQAPAKYTADACRERLILDVPGREGTHTVQDEIDVLDEAWRQCYYSRQTQTGPCPMCSTPAPVVTVAQVTLSGEPHAHFFVAAARTSEGEPEPGAAKPSVSVSAFRTTYRLCAVIFQCTTSIERFFCQAFYGGCWHAQNVWGGKVAHEHLHVYEACPSFKGVRGKAVPVFFAYVREGEEMPADTSEYDSDHEGLSLRTEERKEARKTFNLAMENVKNTIEIIPPLLYLVEYEPQETQMSLLEARTSIFLTPTLTLVVISVVSSSALAISQGQGQSPAR